MSCKLPLFLAAVITFNASAWGQGTRSPQITTTNRVIDRAVFPELYEEYAQKAYGEIALYKGNQGPLVTIENDAVSQTQSTFDDVNDFKEICLDNDESDLVIVNDSEHGKEVTFSCMEDGAIGEARERSFKMIYNSSGIGAEQVSEMAVLRADPVPAKRQIGMIDAVGAAVAITAAVKFGGVIAKKYFPEQPDKPLHSGGSGLLAVAGANFAYYIKNMSPERSAVAGGIFSFLFGVAKETIDKGTGGHGSTSDLKANMCGIIIGSIISYFQLKMIDQHHKAQFKLNIPQRQLKF